MRLRASLAGQRTMSSPARVDWRRVVLLAVVIAFGSVLAWKAMERDYLRRIAPVDVLAAPSAPVFDVGDLSTRRALLRLADSDAWIGRHCDETTPETYVVADTPGWRPDPVFREARITLREDGGRLVFRSRPSLEPGDATVREVRLDTRTVQQLRAMLAENGYPATMPPAMESSGCNDSGTVTIESCLSGRYYGVVRSCVEEPVHELVGEVLALAELQAGGTRRGGAE